MNLAELNAELDDLPVVLSPIERNRLLNEAHTELCIRSEWTRANVNLGPTVADINTYELPSTVHRPLSLTVDAVPYEPSDVETARFLRTGDLHLRAHGIWYLTFASSGTESVALYPTPGTAGLTVIATSIVYPEEMTAGADEPRVPADFHRALVDYAKASVYSSDRETADQFALYQDSFERAVSRLRRHRLSRVGRGPVQMRVAGVNA